MRKKIGGVLVGLVAVAVIVFVVVLAIKGEGNTGWVPTETEDTASTTEEASMAIQPSTGEANGATENPAASETVREQQGSVDFGEVYRNMGTFTAANMTIEVAVGAESERADGVLLQPAIRTGAEDVSFVYYPHRGSICDASNTDPATGSYDYGVKLPAGSETVWVSDGTWGSEELSVGIHVIDNRTQHLLGLFSVTIKRNDDEKYYIAEFNCTELHNEVTEKIVASLPAHLKEYCPGISVENIEIDSVYIEVVNELYAPSCTGIFSGVEIYSGNIISYPVFAATINTKNSAFSRIIFYYSTMPIPDGQQIPMVDRVLPLGYDVPDFS